MNLRSAEVLLSFCLGCGALRLRDVKDKLQQLFTDEENILPDVCAICGKSTLPGQNDDSGKKSGHSKQQTFPEPSHESIKLKTARVSRKQNKPLLEETEDVSRVNQCSKEQMKPDVISIDSKEDDVVNNSSILEDDTVSTDGNSSWFREGAVVDSDSAEEDEGREEDAVTGPSGFDMTGTIKTDVDWKLSHNQKHELRKEACTSVPRKATRLSTGAIATRQYNVKEDKEDEDDDVLGKVDNDKDDANDNRLIVVKTEQQEHSTVKKPYHPRTTEGIDPEILAFITPNKDPMRPFKCRLCNEVCFPYVTHFQLHIQSHTGKKPMPKPYKCEVCGRNFRLLLLLNLHRKVHRDRSQAFKCTMRRCKYSYSTRHDLESHMEVHRVNKPLKCKTCGLGFATKSILQVHKTTHSENRLFPCKQCGKTFSHAQRLLTHSYIHLNADRFKCDQCNYTCENRHRLMRHKKVHKKGDAHLPKPPAEKCSKIGDIDISGITKCLDPKVLAMMGNPQSSSSPFKCKHCTATSEFKTINPFLKHMRFAHPEVNVVDKPYRCNICHKQFKKHSILIHHFTAHSNIKSFACPDCDKKYKKRTHLDEHKKTHQPLEYMCSVCGAFFLSNSNLKSHMNRIHLGLRPFKCDQCDKSFSEMRNMEEHSQRIHRNDRPWMCDLCGKRFKAVGDLRRHTSSHSSVKKYACDMCDYQCKRQDYLRKHLRIHTGEKPYHCEACEMRFSNRTSLVLHQKKHHGGVVKPSGTSPQSVTRKLIPGGGGETLHTNQTDESSVGAASYQYVTWSRQSGDGDNNQVDGNSSSIQTVKTSDSRGTSGDETHNAIDSIATIHFAHMQSAFSM